MVLSTCTGALSKLLRSESAVWPLDTHFVIQWLTIETDSGAFPSFGRSRNADNVFNSLAFTRANYVTRNVTTDGRTTTVCSSVSASASLEASGKRAPTSKKKNVRCPGVEPGDTHWEHLGHSVAPSQRPNAFCCFFSILGISGDVQCQKSLCLFPFALAFSKQTAKTSLLYTCAASNRCGGQVGASRTCDHLLIP